MTCYNARYEGHYSSILIAVNTSVWQHVKFTHSCYERSDSVQCQVINTLKFTHSSEKVAARHTTDQRLPDTPAYELWLCCKRSEWLLSSGGAQVKKETTSCHQNSERRLDKDFSCSLQTDGCIWNVTHLQQQKQGSQHYKSHCVPSLPSIPDY